MPEAGKLSADYKVDTQTLTGVERVCSGGVKMSDDEYGNEDTGGFGEGDYNEDALNDLEENEFAEVPQCLYVTIPSS